MNILLVDDRSANLLALEAVLSELGQNIVKAESGEEALRQLAERDFAVVLLDVQMPGLDGFETAKRIRGSERSKNTPIIFVSAFSDDPTFSIENAYALGAVDYLVKPLVPIILKSKVAIFVELFRNQERVRRQKARLEAEAASTLRLVFESVRDFAIVTIDPNGLIANWNAGAENVFGYEDGDIVGLPFGTLFTPEDRANLVPERELAKALSTGRAEDERWHVRKDGVRFFASGVVNSVTDDSGAVIGFTKVARDITAKKRAEEQVRFLAELFSKTQQLTDSESVIATTAQLLAEQLGADRCAYASVENESVYVVTADYTRGLASVAGRWPVPAFGEEHLRTMLSNEPYIVSDTDTDARITDSDLPAYRAANIRALICVPLFKDGRFTAAMKVHQATPRAWTQDEIDLVRQVVARCGETLERARVDRELKLSQERFRLFMDISPAAAWMTDTAGRMVYLSERYLKTFKLPDGDVLGRSAFEIFPTHLAETYVQNIQAAADANCPIETIETGIRVDGSEGQFLVYKFPIKEPGGILVGGIAVDISERVKAEAALRENDRRKDEFLAMLSHELRNPLAAVKNAVTLMKKSNEEEYISFSKEVIERQVRQLARLVDDLLDVSRITRGKIRLRRESCDAGTIIRRAVLSVEPLVNERNHRVITDFEEGTLPLRADPTRIEQVIVNLLANAAKYTENGGEIHVTAALDCDHIFITVRDNGIGIPSEKLPEMFELFAQGTRTIARSEGGLGIGLTIVQKLVELHDGSIVATSEGLGKGTQFTVCLPAALHSESHEFRSATDRAVVVRGARILVVDDNHDTANALARVLKVFGNEVEIAHDGMSALEIASTLKPEFILLDIGLPDMDGYETAQKLRETAWCKTSVIVAVSGYGQDEDRRRSREAGFDHHLVKPIDFDALAALLSQQGQSPRSDPSQ